MKKNVSGQKIGAQMVSAADGSAFTGAVTVSVTGDAGSQATGSVGSGACAHEGNGYHTYAPAQAETNYSLIAFTFTGSGAVPTTVQVETSYPQTADAGAISQDVLDIVDAPDIGLRQIMEKLLYGVAANIVNDKGNYSLSTDTILAFWETLTTDGDDVTNSFGKAFVDLVASMAALPTATDIRDAVFARPFHSKMGSFTYEEVAAFTLLAVSGKLTGANTTTSSIRNITDAATAISVTTDATGRTAVSYTIGSVHA
jgi:hypothetical protein